MKVLTLNFLTCAVKTCKSSSDSFPLHPKDAELVSDDVELNPQLLVNLLPRIDWNALRTTSREVWFYCFNFSPWGWDNTTLVCAQFLFILLFSVLSAVALSISTPSPLPPYSGTYPPTLVHTSLRFSQESITNTNIHPQLGFPELPEQAPTAEELEADEKTLKDLHTLLMETQMSEGKLVCGHCGHEYAVREGIANFLLPSHLV